MKWPAIFQKKPMPSKEQLAKDTVTGKRIFKYAIAFVGVYTIVEYGVHNSKRTRRWVDSLLPREKERVADRTQFIKEEFERAQDRREHWNYFSTPPYGGWQTKRHLANYFELQLGHRERNPYVDVSARLNKEIAQLAAKK